MLEEILTDIHKADLEWNVVLLFQPNWGTHESGESRETAFQITFYRM